MKSRNIVISLLTCSALILASTQVFAKSDSETETRYQGAPGGINSAEAKTMIDSEEPQMTVE
jgi:uncharacterized protein YdeI (BOF family)